MRVHLLTLSLLLLLWGTTVRSQEEEADNDGDDVADILISACVSENWIKTAPDDANVGKATSCYQCFEEARYPLTADGLPKFKSCIATFLPRISPGCAGEMAALSVENGGDNLLLCLQSQVDTQGSGDCLAQATAADPVDKMTQAVECIQKLHQFYLEKGGLVRAKVLGDAADKDAAEDDDFTLPELMKVVADVHCGSATKPCQECFGSATAPADMAKCAGSFLLPEYKDCQAGLEALPAGAGEEAGKGVYTCYRDRLVRATVASCLATQEPVVQTLFKVISCGTDKSKWVWQV